VLLYLYLIVLIEVIVGVAFTWVRIPPSPPNTIDKPLFYRGFFISITLRSVKKTVKYPRYYKKRPYRKLIEPDQWKKGTDFYYVYYCNRSAKLNPVTPIRSLETVRWIYTKVTNKPACIEKASL
jgi:hypothetical protein